MKLFLCSAYAGDYEPTGVVVAETEEEAEEKFKKELSAVRAIAKSLVKRTDEIISCILSPYSNGKMEGTNNKIKLMKRRGYGYRNIQRFALRVRLETANILS